MMLAGEIQEGAQIQFCFYCSDYNSKQPNESQIIKFFSHYTRERGGRRKKETQVKNKDAWSTWC